MLCTVLAGHLWRCLTDVCWPRLVCASIIQHQVIVVFRSNAITADNVRHWLAVLCKLKVMWAGHVRRHSTILCMSKAMRAGNTLCWLTVMCRSNSMWAVHAQQWLSKVYKPRLMRVVNGQRRMRDMHRPQSMRDFYDQCCLAYDSYRRWTSLAQRAQALADVLTSLARSALLDDVVWHWPLQMSPSWYTHATGDTCKPCMMLHSIDRRHFPYVHMPCKMCAGLGWWYHSLANIAWMKKTSHGRWCLQLVGVNFAKLMHSCHGWYVCYIDDVAYNYYMSLSWYTLTM